MKILMPILFFLFPFIFYAHESKIRNSYIFYKNNERIVGYKIDIGNFANGKFESITYYIYKNFYIKTIEVKKTPDYTKDMKYTVKKRLQRFFTLMLKSIFFGIIKKPSNLKLNIELYVGNEKNSYFFYICFNEDNKNLEVRHYGKTFKIKDLFEIIDQKFRNQEIKRLLNMVYNDKNLLGQLAVRYSKYKNEIFFIKEKYIPCEKAEGKFMFDCNIWEKAKIIDNMQIIKEDNNTK